MKKLPEKIYRAHIITLSDRAYRGEYEDLSGMVIREELGKFFTANEVESKISYALIPDDESMLAQEVRKALDSGTDMIFTCGGTGIGPRDITPEVIKPFIEKEIPGIMDLIRIKYGLQKPNAVISRSIAGIHKKTFIYTLPGSVKAVKEYMSEILQLQKHLLFMLYGIDAH